MRILYHHRTQGKTVEGVHIREIVKALKALGHEVALVSPPGVDPFAEVKPDKRKRSPVFNVLSFLSKHLPQVFFELMELSYNIFAYSKICSVVKNDKIELIYERYAFYSFAGVMAAKKFHLPFVLEVNEVSGIERQRGQVLKGLAKMLEKLIFNKADKVLTVSSFLKNQVAGMVADTGKIKVVPNAVDLNMFDPSVSGSRVREKYKITNETILGFVGSFSVWDRLEFLIDTFEKMLKINQHIRLMLIGDGFNKTTLFKYVEERGLGDKIIFTGRVTRTEITEYLAAVDIFVIPHSNPFGSPVVLFEYMAMAKPAVCPDLLPITDVIDNGVNGIVFNTGESEDLSKSLFMLINDKARRFKIGANARQCAEQKHTWEKNAEQVFNMNI